MYQRDATEKATAGFENVLKDVKSQFIVGKGNTENRNEIKRRDEEIKR